MPHKLTEKELVDIGYALVTASAGDEMNWKTAAQDLLYTLRQTHEERYEFAEAIIHEWDNCDVLTYCIFCHTEHHTPECIVHKAVSLLDATK